ncbi:MAG: hypothetical protein ACRD9R_22010 [Pyrinomonadaceae bacterium]
MAIVLVLFSVLNFKSALSAQSKAVSAQTPQASIGVQTRQGALGKKRARKPRRGVKRNKCMPKSPSAAVTTSDERQPPVTDSPPLILDPTDREPGPPKEIVPQHIDPAEMPAIKKPRKKKTNPPGSH